MERRFKWLKRGIAVSLLFIGAGICSTALSNEQLEGRHLLQNIIGDGIYHFNIKPAQTGSYTFKIDDFQKDAAYEVYCETTNALVSKGAVKWNEGYRPFIEMALKEDNTYKVKLMIEDKNVLKWAKVQLVDRY